MNCEHLPEGICDGCLERRFEGVVGTNVDAEALRDNPVLGVIAVVIELRRSSQTARIVVLRPDGRPV